MANLLELNGGKLIAFLTKLNEKGVTAEMAEECLRNEAALEARVTAFKHASPPSVPVKPSCPTVKGVLEEWRVEVDVPNLSLERLVADLRSVTSIKVHVKEKALRSGVRAASCIGAASYGRRTMSLAPFYEYSPGWRDALRSEFLAFARLNPEFPEGYALRAIHGRGESGAKPPFDDFNYVMTVNERPARIGSLYMETARGPAILPGEHRLVVRVD